MPISKEAFLKPRLGEREVELPSGDTVRVRGLSRAEVRELFAEGDPADVKTLAFGLVEPSLTIEESEQLVNSTTFAEIKHLTDSILELSGLRPDTAKEAWKEMESDTDAEFRDVPGTEAEDDGRPDAGGDA